MFWYLVLRLKKYNGLNYILGIFINSSKRFIGYLYPDRPIPTRMIITRIFNEFNGSS